jgi:hypothetical protein
MPARPINTLLTKMMATDDTTLDTHAAASAASLGSRRLGVVAASVCVGG